MSFPKIEKPWDFSAVHSLIDTLSKKEQNQDGLSCKDGQADRVDNEQVKQPGKPATTIKSALSAGLGDFSQIWQYLGVPLIAERKNTAGLLSTSPNLQQRVPGKIEYTSDGAAYKVSAATKKLQWRDEINEGSLTDFAPFASDADNPNLTKKQRKKVARAHRKHEEANTRRAVSDVESEAEMPKKTTNPAAKASIHSLPIDIAPKAKSVPRTADKHISTPQSSPEHTSGKKPHRHENAVAVPLASRTNLPSSVKHDDDTLQKVADSGRRYLARYNSEPPEGRNNATPERAVKKEWPVSDPFSHKALGLRPSSVRPGPRTTKPKDDAMKAVESTVVTPLPVPQPATYTKSGRQTITPKIIRSGEDRHWAFLLKLINNFWEDRSSLVSPANLSNHSSNPAGIHVFVDASNIFIGFHDQLKKARGIPAHVRVPQVDMSFDALALLMERRRPVAKRVLAGSTPLVPAFEIARNVGYECAILDKVYKARELTERQRHFLELDAKVAARKQAFFDRRAKSQASGNNSNGYTSEGYTSGGSTGSYTDHNTTSSKKSTEIPTHAPQRFVEQGVDEVLHLKILESIVDASEEHPPSTIVLATGDAAQAEYSGGFMRMVERALEKGWSVEVVSWSANISGMYKRNAFREKWGDRVRVIELDDYAEELLDM